MEGRMETDRQEGGMGCAHKPLLLSTLLGVLFLVQFNNFDQTRNFYWSYTLLLKLPVLMCLFLCGLATRHG